MKIVNDFRIGARVQVYIAYPEEYAVGAAESLNGKIGTIEALRPGDATTSRRALVRFDTPAAPWHSNQRPCESFWFDVPRELVTP